MREGTKEIKQAKDRGIKPFGKMLDSEYNKR